MVKIYTKKGDDGTTGLLYGGRVDKNDIRTEVYGTLDETVSALGVARGAGLVPRVEEIVVRVQREMFVAGAELATREGSEGKLLTGVSKVSPEMAEEAERDIDELLEAHPLPKEFLLPGESLGAAALDLARSIVRRAERQAVTMQRAGLIKDAEVLRYLNRVSDLLYACARYEEGERGRSAKPSREH